MKRTDFGRKITRDLSTPEKEYAALMYPVSQVFDWDRWQDGFNEYWPGDQNRAIKESFLAFKNQVLKNFTYYRVPVIALDSATSKEAVCVVFEKVNTGGKPLDAFEPRRRDVRRLQTQLAKTGLVRAMKGQGAPSPPRGDTPACGFGHRHPGECGQYRLSPGGLAILHPRPATGRRT